MPSGLLSIFYQVNILIVITIRALKGSLVPETLCLTVYRNQLALTETNPSIMAAACCFRLGTIENAKWANKDRTTPIAKAALPPNSISSEPQRRAAMDTWITKTVLNTRRPSYCLLDVEPSSSWAHSLRQPWILVLPQWFCIKVLLSEVGPQIAVNTMIICVTPKGESVQAKPLAISIHIWPAIRVKWACPSPWPRY